MHVLVAGKDAKAAADEAAKLDGVAKVLHCGSATASSMQLAEPIAALDRLAGRGYDALVAAGHDDRQERHAARRGACST